MNFNENFDDHSRWRRGFSAELQHLADWLRNHDLMDAAVDERLAFLRQRVQGDKVMVAFVAEFSRGKSELINALFFAGYGRRIMPASAGRTTMCPTELGYDPETPPSLRLLPIATRLQARSLAEWRDNPQEWETLPLDVGDPDGLAASMARVAEVIRVTPEEAARLGFWQADGGTDRSMVGADGCLEVPRWRHALINIAHPILKQGLVILDTPGLNAIGAEPELTLSLLPQAHSVVFILGADTGVTQSDLRIWREHLGSSGANPGGRMVVLNKIDTLWDELSTDSEVAAQIRRQCQNSAAILGVDADHVLAVSAQKGLVAKIHGDDALLQASHLPDLEQMLVSGIIGQRRQLLVDAVTAGVQALLAQVGQVMRIRNRDLTEQIQELESLRGKNTAVIRHMRLRIEQEQQEFEHSGGKIQAVRSVHMRHVASLYDTLGHTRVAQAVTQFTQRLKEPGLKWGVRGTYDQTFQGLRQLLTQATGIAQEINAMLSGSFVQLNTEFGMALRMVPPPDMAAFQAQLDEIEHDHVQYLGVGHTFKLAQPEFCERLGRALLGRLREVFDSAVNELDAWNKAAATQLDAQLRDRRRNFVRRVEAVTRIQEAAGGLDDRVQELADQMQQHQCVLDELAQRAQAMLAPVSGPNHLAEVNPGGEDADTQPVPLAPR
jgi:hypothetical protein